MGLRIGYKLKYPKKSILKIALAFSFILIPNVLGWTLCIVL